TTGGEMNEVMLKDVGVGRNSAFVNDVDLQVAAETGNEKYALSVPFGPEFVINVGTIHDDDGATLNGDGMRSLNIAMKGTGELNEAGHVVVVIQKDMSLNATFVFFKLRPGEQRKTQRNRGRIQGQQFVFEAKRFGAWSEHGLAAKALECFPKQLLKQRRRPVQIGISQARFVGSFGNSQVNQLTQTTRQSVADQAQGIRISQVTKQHGDKLCPAGKSTRMPFGFGLLHQCGEFGSGEMFQ